MGSSPVPGTYLRENETSESPLKVTIPASNDETPLRRSPRRKNFDKSYIIDSKGGGFLSRSVADQKHSISTRQKTTTTEQTVVDQMLPTQEQNEVQSLKALNSPHLQTVKSNSPDTQATEVKESNSSCLQIPKGTNSKGDQSAQRCKGKQKADSVHDVSLLLADFFGADPMKSSQALRSLVNIKDDYNVDIYMLTMTLITLNNRAKTLQNHIDDVNLWMDTQDTITEFNKLVQEQGHDYTLSIEDFQHTYGLTMPDSCGQFFSGHSPPSTPSRNSIYHDSPEYFDHQVPTVNKDVVAWRRKGESDQVFVIYECDGKKTGRLEQGQNYNYNKNVIPEITTIRGRRRHPRQSDMRQVGVVARATDDSHDDYCVQIQIDYPGYAYIKYVSSIDLDQYIRKSQSTLDVAIHKLFIRQENIFEEAAQAPPDQHQSLNQQFLPTSDSLRALDWPNIAQPETKFNVMDLPQHQTDTTLPVQQFPSNWGRGMLKSSHNDKTQQDATTTRVMHRVMDKRNPLSGTSAKVQVKREEEIDG
ncbi:predicted protein [Histoplasma capsulatum G186AR]|uniref:Uncharacterized protein n=2 Tax=Ajellomyces capsulatus TaxID=5037 RepID=C0NPU8_AJECG|nr:uncharacterized protein HCBG_05178 [Histoplasma capsulatum G186AR]EEH06958.1 predicted protein [Histoplasma capsulatum G186AR]KAG5294012.1 hypothetical protein I7I52_05512 [Histoplasma capsulatum]QSS75464.1 hypothetical protein I7I50_04603 [Histoplasma capsulatum G186AR]